MKRIIISVGALTLLLLLPHCAKNISEPVRPVAEDTGSVYILSSDLRIEMISPGAYLVVHSFPWPANSLLVNLGRKGFVMVDTPYTPEATVQVLEWMERKFKQLPVLAINTGFHVDNLGGNAALKARKISVYGTRLTAELVRTKGAASLRALTPWLKGEKNNRFRKHFEALTLSGPGIHLFPDSDGLSRLLGGSVDIFYPGPTHAKDNLIIFFRGKSLLFGGCMVLPVKAEKPGNVADADMKQWPWNVEKVLQRYASAIIVVPGHGLHGDVRLLRHTIDVLHRYRRSGK